MITYLILACALLIVLITLERAHAILLRRRVNASQLVKEVLICIEAREFDGAIELCSRSHAPVSRMLKSGLAAHQENFNHNEALARANTPSEITFSMQPDVSRKEKVIQSAMEETALSAYPPLRRWTGYLPALSRIALLLGITGTVTEAMRVLGSGQTDTQILLAGLAGSLNTTLLGLLVMTPTVLIHAFFTQKTQCMIEEAESASRAVLGAMLRAEPQPAGMPRRS
jgi:biopolymer transport protein ExbB